MILSGVLDGFAYIKWMGSEFAESSGAFCEKGIERFGCGKAVRQKKSSGNYPEQEGGGKRVEKQFSLTLSII